MSDAETEKKLCKNSSNANNCTTANDNQGIVASYGTRPQNWPSQAASSGSTDSEGAKNVATNIISLTKDEKAVWPKPVMCSAATIEIPRCEVLVLGVPTYCP